MSFSATIPFFPEDIPVLRQGQGQGEGQHQDQNQGEGQPGLGLSVQPDEDTSRETPRQDNVCNEVITCTGFSRSTRETFPDPEDCRSFYFCRGTNIRKDTCDSGQSYDVVSRSCVDSEDAVCQEPCNQPSQATATPADVTVDPLSPEAICDPNFQCPTNARNKQYPTPDDCSRYFECASDSFTVYKRFCPPSIPFYNPSRNRCGSDAAACFKCPTTAATTVPTTEPTTEPFPVQPPDDSKRLEIPDPYNVCNGIITCTGFSTSTRETFPDPEDCRSFYFCRGTNIGKATCDSGQLYDVVSRSCVDSEDAVCQEPCPTTATTVTTTEPKSERITVRNSNGMGRETSAPYDVCNGITCSSFSTSTIETFPDPFDCRSFYLCQGRNIRKATCVGGQSYDVVSRSCVDSEDAVCQEPCNQYNSQLTAATAEITADPLSPEAICDPNFQCPANARNKLYPNPDDCTRYVECAGDPPSAQMRFCPPAMPFFNPSTDRCSADAGACFTCPTTDATTIPTTDLTTEAVTVQTGDANWRETREPYDVCNGITCSGFSRSTGETFPDPEDCRSFYFCRGTNIRKDTCDGGQSYDVLSRTCVDSENAHCQMPCNQRFQLTAAPGEITVDPLSPEAICDPNFQCPTNVRYKAYPHPDDCRRYIECVN